MPEIYLLSQEDHTGTILVTIAGGLSTLAVSALLLYMAFLAILRPLKQLTTPQKLPPERIFLTTHLGYYLTCLLISGLFGGVAALLEIVWVQQGVVLQDGRCNSQGIFLQLGDIGTATFSVIIAFHTMNNLVIQKNLSTITVLFVIALGWAFTIVLAIIGPAMSPGFYDIEGLWCWISINHDTFQVFGNLVPLLLSVILMVFLYSATYIKLRVEASGPDDDTISLSGTVALSNADYRKFLRPIARKLFYYPVAFAILILPISIVRIAILLRVNVPDYAIIIAAVCDALMGFANVVVYVTTRNVGPSINWEGLRISAVGLLRSDTSDFKPISRPFPVSDRSFEKTGSAYSIGEPRLIQTTNSSDIRPFVTSPSMKPVAPPTFRAFAPGTKQVTVAPSEYSPDEAEPTPAFVHRTGATDSVARWRERQGTDRAANPRVTLPTSPQQTPTHLHGSRSLSSLRSYNRTPSVSLNPQSSISSPRPAVNIPKRADSADSAQIIESYFDVPDVLRPRVPQPMRSNTPSMESLARSNQWSFASQDSLVSHIRTISNSSTSSSSSYSNSSSNPRIQPTMPGGANLPFALYPSQTNSSLTALAEALRPVDGEYSSTLGERVVPPGPMTAESSYTPSTSGYKTPKTPAAVQSSWTRI